MTKDKKTLINNRLETALKNLYHNATMAFPSDIENFDHYLEWFQDQASFEIEHINGGGAHCINIRLTPSYCQAPYVPEDLQGKSTKVINRWRLLKRDKAIREINRYSRHERIIEYGQLNTYGRSGATLAPEQLIRTGGGSSFSINYDIAEEWPIGNKVDLILTLEAFNDSVKQWNAAIPEAYQEYLLEQGLEEESTQIEEFATLLHNA